MAEARSAPRERTEGSRTADSHAPTGQDSGRRPLDLRLYVILDAGAIGDRSLKAVAEQAVAGGATLLQVRGKRVSTRGLLSLSRDAISVAGPAGVPVLVNDRVDVALAADADGVHLGEDDLPVGAARAVLGPAAIIGFSTAKLDLAREAEAAGADYLGAGDVFGTVSKEDADPPIGLSGLEAVVRSVGVPVVAIGGIHLGRASSAVRRGAAGVAVISAVVGADDVELAASRLRHEIDQALGSRQVT